MANLTRSVIDALKKKLKASGIPYREVGRALDLSLPSVKRLLAGKSLSFERFERICGLLNVQPSKLLAEAEGDATGEVYYFTTAQEKILAQDVRMYSFFRILVHGVAIERVMRRFKISRVKAESYLLKLDRIGLIEYRTGLKFKILVPRKVHWQRGGPIDQKINRAAIRTLFSQPRHEGPKSIYDLLIIKMSPRLQAEVSSRLHALIDEVYPRAIAEEVLSQDAQTMFLFTLFEPVPFSIIRKVEIADP